MQKKQYVITDGNKYVKQNVNGKYSLTSNLSIADILPTKDKAESILKNSVPKHMRFKLYVAELKDGNIIGQETTSLKQVVDCRERVIEPKDDTYHLSQYSFDLDEDVQKMIKGFEDVKEVLKKYANNHSHQALEDKTMTMIYIVEDIKHYHGKKALNVRDGFRLNKLEDKAILKRISVKNQLEISRKLTKHFSLISESINDICATIDDLRNQRYKPRVLIDLFENDNLDIEF